MAWYDTSGQAAAHPSVDGKSLAGLKAHGTTIVPVTTTASPARAVRARRRDHHQVAGVMFGRVTVTHDGVDQERNPRKPLRLNLVIHDWLAWLVVFKSERAPMVGPAPVHGHSAPVKTYPVTLAVVIDAKTNRDLFAESLD